MTEQTRRTWAEIHLDRLERNYRTLRALAPHSAFGGLVKANAYGHGAVPVAKKLEELGTDWLLVACLDEAIELREGGVKAPILILGYTPAAYTDQLLRYRLTQTVYDPALAAEQSRLALSAGGRLSCFLKADTGMSRLGVLADEGHMEQAVETLAEMYRLPGLDPVGLFQHFSDADTCPSYSRMQMERFAALRQGLAERGCRFRVYSACAGAATLNYPQAHYDLVRPGILLYGHLPDPACAGMAEVEPVMEVKTRVASVKALPRGTCISYGRTYTLQRDSLVAAVPIGYADGLFRLLSGRQEMLVQGVRVPQIGRVCMDMCMLDVTEVPEVRPDDIVTVFGDGLPLEEKAETLGTITYELLCAVSPRVSRVYLEA